MQLEFFVTAIADQVKKAKTVQQARDYLLEMGFDEETADQARAVYEDRVRAVKIMERPQAVSEREHRDWYAGPSDRDTCWPALKSHLVDKKGWDEDVVESIDDASTKVVSLLDCPGDTEFATRGLVLGYVQSGKTANFTAVIAKAADAGFKLFIVLAGLHNKLREQSQVRLEKELLRLNPKHWLMLTTAEDDFIGHSASAEAMLTDTTHHRVLAVIKKNKAPLQKLLRWLPPHDSAVLANCPVLIIDDESDQASINTGTFEERSRTNELIVELINRFPRCAYVGYTATPFANVLADPTWPRGLYPKDFIVDLPKPDSYFGTERIFGTEPVDASSSDDDGLDFIRIVPEDDVDLLKAPGRNAVATFEPQVPDSMRRAIDWFVVAAAIRLARGQADQHMSMLVHTTLYTDLHQRLAAEIDVVLAELEAEVRARSPQGIERLRDLWEQETSRVPADVTGETHILWPTVLDQLPVVFDSLKRIIDNGQSEQRLDYPDDSGSIQMVIGGNTLSRGLTLEGLTVSYFLRASTTYDTLLQMGRWFGYRFGYSDLPRIWMTWDLLHHFQHLARVEAEIRTDIERYEREDITPRDFGIRIQTHSTLAVTSPLKMQHAEVAKMSFAKAVKQTTWFRHRDRDWLLTNQQAARGLLAAAFQVSQPERVWDRHWLLRSMPVSIVLDFLQRYHVHDTHRDMQTGHIHGYIEEQNRAGRLTSWNIGVISQKSGVEWDGLLPGHNVVLLTRSKLSGGDGDADLKAIMSQADRCLDFGLDDAPPLRPAERFRKWAVAEGLLATDATRTKFIQWTEDYRSPLDGETHQDPARGLRTPLLLLYPIDKDSKPSGRSKGRRPRVDLNAKEHVVGLALLFPQTTSLTPQDYITVRLSESDVEVPDELLNGEL